MHGPCASLRFECASDWYTRLLYRISHQRSPHEPPTNSGFPCRDYYTGPLRDHNPRTVSYNVLFHFLELLPSLHFAYSSRSLPPTAGHVSSLSSSFVFGVCRTSSKYSPHSIRFHLCKHTYKRTYICVSATLHIIHSQ